MKNHYTQNDEDIYIDKYFGNFIGTFLDIGANDGKTLSNTRFLAEGGWKGDLVEPSPSAYKWLRHQCVEGCRTFNMAINTFDGECDFYESGEHLRVGDVALLSTLIESELTRWKKSGETFQKMKVKCVTFETFYLMAGEPTYDMISIDCEGLDYNILTQIDLDKTGTKLLVIEYNADKDVQKRVEQYCSKFGLSLYHKTYENLILTK